MRLLRPLFIGLLLQTLISVSIAMPAKADSAPVTYSQTFVTNQVPTQAQVDAWNTFRSQLTGTYTQFTFSSSTGASITVSDSTKVQAIANALRTTNTSGTTPTTVTSQTIGSNTWIVSYGCASSNIVAVEISNNSTCNCGVGYTLRPAIGNTNWGGANSATCNGTTQTLSLTFGPVILQLGTPAAPIVSPTSATTIAVSETSTTANATNFRIKVYQSDGTTFVESITVSVSSITSPNSLTGLSPTTLYKITVTALGDNVSYADSNESTQTSVTTLAGISTISLAITAGNNPPKKTWVLNNNGLYQHGRNRNLLLQQQTSALPAANSCGCRSNRDLYLETNN